MIKLPLLQLISSSFINPYLHIQIENLHILFAIIQLECDLHVDLNLTTNWIYKNIHCIYIY